MSNSDFLIYQQVLVFPTITLPDYALVLGKRAVVDKKKLKI
jgi:hypothetical protein